MSDMKDFIIEDGVLKKYIGNDADVVIPDGITTIESSAFRNCTTLKSILLPETLKEIKASAFAGCKNLISIQIPQSVTEIGFNAFSHCETLQKIECLSALESCGADAFNGCLNLQSICMRGSLKRSFKDSFPKEMNLRSCILTSEPDDEEYTKVILDIFGTRTLAFPFLTETLQAGNLLKKKLQSRVTNKKFREQYIPKLITQGETKALEKMLLLVKKMLPEEIDAYIAVAENSVEIRAMLMEYKKNLYSVETLEKMEEIQMEKDLGMREKTLADYKKMFTIKKENDIYVITGYKGADETVYIPSSIKNVPVKCTMKNNQTIKEVFFEEGITEIVPGAFFGCENLKSVFISESVLTIGGSAFSGCSSLADENGFVIVKNILFDYFGTEKEMVIPAGVTRIATKMFSSYKNFESVIIPESVTDMESFAFFGCEKLKNVTIPGGISDIRTNTFAFCRNLESVIISEGVALIGDEAFSNCENLQSIVIPESVQNIGNKAFSGCGQLKIFAPKGSFAEAYAKKKRIRFQKI